MDELKSPAGARAVRRFGERLESILNMKRFVERLARIFHTLSAATCCEPVWRRWPRSPRRTVCTPTARRGTASAASPRLATKGYEISGLGRHLVRAAEVPSSIIHNRGGTWPT